MRMRHLAIAVLLALLAAGYWWLRPNGGCVRCETAVPSPADNNPGLDGYGCPGCNVILISVDTLRADHLGCYGYGMNITPNIDVLAGGSTVFTRAYSTSSKTSPSHMSMMTSLYPGEHSVCNGELNYTGCRHVLEEGIVTLAQALRANNYSTYAYTGGGNVDGKIGFGRGFDRYLDRDFVLDDAAIKALPAIADKGSFFLFLHTYKTHTPYFPQKRTARRLCSGWNSTIPSSESEMYMGLFSRLEDEPESDFSRDFFTDGLRDMIPEGRTREGAATEEGLIRNLTGAGYSREGVVKAAGLLRSLYARNATYPIPATFRVKLIFLRNFTDADVGYLRCLYDSEIFEMDARIGRLMDVLARNNLSENTVVILTSDHGEEFMDHGGLSHHQLFSEIIRVPLILRDPGRRKTGREDGIIASGVDIFPTVLDIVGVKGVNHTHGKPLFSVLADRSGPGPGAAYSEVFGYVRGGFYNPEFYPSQPWVDWEHLSMRSLVWDGYHLMVYDNETRLFNLSDDPREGSDIAGAEDASGMAERMGAYPRYQPGHVEGDAPKIDPEAIEKLESLGYL